MRRLLCKLIGWHRWKRPSLGVLDMPTIESTCGCTACGEMRVNLRDRPEWFYYGRTRRPDRWGEERNAA